MTAPSFVRACRAALILGVLVAGPLAACAGKYSGAWDLAGQPGLLLDVKRYYEAHATEEFGRCRWPRLEGVTASRVLDQTPERLVVRLRYYYRDRFYDRDDACLAGGALRWMCAARLANSPCRGFSERTFTIDKRGETPEIVTMTGGRHGSAGLGR